MSGRWARALALVLMLSLPAVTQAGPPARVDLEVQRLLTSIATSHCRFYRNGKWYDPKRAAKHLRDKYDYLAAHARVTTAEDFIDLAATRSSVSGEPYLLKCGAGAAMPAADWLRALLVKNRSAQPAR